MYLTGVVCYLVAWLILGQDGRDQLSKESSMDFMVISNSLLLLLLFPHLLPSCVSFSSFHFFLSNFLFSWLFSLKVPSAETLSIADDQADMLLIDGFISKILLETNRYFKQNPKFLIDETSNNLLFNFATLRTRFSFKGSFYDQCHGITWDHHLHLYVQTYLWGIMRTNG